MCTKYSNKIVPCFWEYFLTTLLHSYKVLNRSHLALHGGEAEMLITKAKCTGIVEFKNWCSRNYIVVTFTEGVLNP